MSNTASLDLCKELYELSGWDDTQNVCSYAGEVVDKSGAIEYLGAREIACPAYDLGYLLRKLPETLPNVEHNFSYRLKLSPLGPGWCASYSNHRWADAHKSAFSRRGYDSESIAAAYTFYKDTPEDAAAKLAIELFKQGVLK
jgi:hypothetical protein